MARIIFADPCATLYRGALVLQLEAKPALRSVASESKRLLLQVRTWLLMIPLVYFAADGRLLTQNKDYAGQFSSNGDATGGGVARIEQLVVWCLACFIMSRAFPRITRAATRHKAFSAFALLAFVSISWSPDPVDALRRTVLFGLTLLFSFYLAEYYDPQEQMLLILFTGVIAVIASYLVVLLLPGLGYGYEGEWRGIFGHKNGLGMFVIFLISPAFFLRFRQSLVGIATAGIVGFAAVLVLMSQSRTAWLLAFVFACYVCAYKLIARFRRRDAVLLSVAVMSIAGVMISLAVTQFDSLLQLLGKSADLSGRLQIWKAVALAISKHPFLGYGYGGFWDQSQGESMNVMMAVGFPLGHAHNGYLNLWLQLGLVGLLLFIWSLVAATRNGVKSLWLGDQNYVAWCLGIILLVIVGNIDESFIMQYNSLATMLYVMVCVGMSKSARGDYAE
jgi:exopolysaccharide production protein ExoQ